jgi:hypothetical protein
MSACEGEHKTLSWLFFQSLMGPRDLIECQGNITNLYVQNFEHEETISLETTTKYRS